MSRHDLQVHPRDLTIESAIPNCACARACLCGEQGAAILASDEARYRSDHTVHAKPESLASRVMSAAHKDGTFRAQSEEEVSGKGGDERTTYHLGGGFNSSRWRDLSYITFLSRMYR